MFQTIKVVVPLVLLSYSFSYSMNSDKEKKRTYVQIEDDTVIKKNKKIKKTLPKEIKKIKQFLEDQIQECNVIYERDIVNRINNVFLANEENGIKVLSDLIDSYDEIELYIAGYALSQLIENGNEKAMELFDRLAKSSKENEQNVVVSALLLLIYHAYKKGSDIFFHLSKSLDKNEREVAGLCILRNMAGVYSEIGKKLLYELASSSEISARNAAANLLFSYLSDNQSLITGKYFLTNLAESLDANERKTALQTLYKMIENENAIQRFSIIKNNRFYIAHILIVHFKKGEKVVYDINERLYSSKNKNVKQVSQFVSLGLLSDQK